MTGRVLADAYDVVLLDLDGVVYIGGHAVPHAVEALREGFLQRVGKLVNRNDRLVLFMETSAIDVLLDYLPWNLSIIKLPWLKDLLYVEWR